MVINFSIKTLAAFVSACLWDLPNSDDSFNPSINILQEWCQSKGFNLPVYKIIEVSRKNGDPKRFCCDIFIEGLKESSAFGKSHKQAETNAARVLIEKFITTGKI